MLSKLEKVCDASAPVCEPSLKCMSIKPLNADSIDQLAPLFELVAANSSARYNSVQPSIGPSHSASTT